MKVSLSVQRRQAWLASQACACGSTDRLQVQLPPDVVGNFWGLREEKRAPIVARLVAKCWTCHYDALVARRGQQRVRHGTRSMYRYGCRCQACHDAERTHLKARYVPRPRKKTVRP